MNPARLLATLFLLVALGVAGLPTRAFSAEPSHSSKRSLTETGIEWPTQEKLWRTISLADYNTRVVFGGVTALGAAGGLVGTFLLLRKRSLLSDTVSHCTLPGIAIGSHLAARVPDRYLRPALATMMAVVGAKLSL